MDQPELNWERKNKIGLSEISDKFKELTNEIIKKEVFDIAGKIEVLKRLGVFSSDNEKLKELNEKLNNLKFSVKK